MRVEKFVFFFLLRATPVSNITANRRGLALINIYLCPDEFITYRNMLCGLVKLSKINLGFQFDGESLCMFDLLFGKNAPALYAKFIELKCHVCLYC
jgi:hypothetical protein